MGTIYMRVIFGSFFLLNHIQLQFVHNFFDYLEIYNLVLDIF